MCRFKRGLSLVELMIIIAIVAILAAIAIPAFSGKSGQTESDAIRVANGLGMDNPKVTQTITGWGVSRAGCGEDDGVAFKVHATNNKEQPVDFTVCCGSAYSQKGCTPRF